MDSDKISPRHLGGAGDLDLGLGSETWFRDLVFWQRVGRNFCVSNLFFSSFDLIENYLFSMDSDKISPRHLGGAGDLGLGLGSGTWFRDLVFWQRIGRNVCVFNLFFSSFDLIENYSFSMDSDKISPRHLGGAGDLGLGLWSVTWIWDLISGPGFFTKGREECLRF